MKIAMSVVYHFSKQLSVLDELQVAELLTPEFLHERLLGLKHGLVGLDGVLESLPLSGQCRHL